MMTADIFLAGIEKVNGEIQRHNDAGKGEDFSLILKRYSRNFGDRTAGLPGDSSYEEHINPSTATFLAFHVSSSDEGFISTERYYEEHVRFVSPDSRDVWKGGEYKDSGGVSPDIVSGVMQSKENAYYACSDAMDEDRIDAGRDADKNIVNDSVRKKESLASRVTGEINQGSEQTGEINSGFAKIHRRDLTGREASIKEVNAKLHTIRQFQIKENEIIRAAGGGKAGGAKSGSGGASAVEDERRLKGSSYLRSDNSLLQKKFTIIKRGEGVAGVVQRVNNKSINKTSNRRVKLSDRDVDRGKVYKYLKERGTPGYSRAGMIKRPSDIGVSLLKQNRSGGEVTSGLRNQNFVQELLVQKKGADLLSEPNSGRSYGNVFQGEIGNTLWRYESFSHIVQSKIDYQLLKNADWNFNDVIREFTLLMDKGGGEARVVLQPESLGTMRLSVRVENNEVSTSIVVENQMVRDLVASNLPVLESSLEEHGFFLGSFEVDVRDEGHEGNALPEEARRGLSLAEKGEKPLGFSGAEGNGTVPGVPWLSTFVNIMV